MEALSQLGRPLYTIVWSLSTKTRFEMLLVTSRTRVAIGVDLTSKDFRTELGILRSDSPFVVSGLELWAVASSWVKTKP